MLPTRPTGTRQPRPLAEGALTQHEYHVLTSMMAFGVMLTWPLTRPNAELGGRTVGASTVWRLWKFGCIAGNVHGSGTVQTAAVWYHVNPVGKHLARNYWGLA